MQIVAWMTNQNNSDDEGEKIEFIWISRKKTPKFLFEGRGNV